MALLAVTVAETLAMGTGLIDDLGQTLKVDIGAQWQPDELFFDLAKDREAVGAMLGEVIGEAAARSYVTETGAKKKAIIRKALAGWRIGVQGLFEAVVFSSEEVMRYEYLTAVATVRLAEISILDLGLLDK